MAFAILCGGDLLTASARGCGPHPCCTKGVCKMTPKSGARFDRCGDDAQPSAPDSPILLTGIDPLVIEILASPSPAAIVVAASDGTSAGIERPPRA
jgi:hypothetical protein